MDLKSSLIDSVSHPPLHAPISSTSPDDILSTLGSTRFDVILINRRPSDSWDLTASLPIRHLSADPGFVFLWVGGGDEEGLERGRECFAKWGFRRAEDIVWVKSNTRSLDAVTGDGLFARTKEHCLMGIRGTVRRSTDSRLVHCNVDTDVMIWEDEGGMFRSVVCAH